MENIISYYRFIDFLEQAVNMASFFFGHCRFCARVRFRREGKERRKERRDGDVLREMEGTDAPGTVISPGEENGERDPWHVERSKKGERKTRYLFYTVRCAINLGSNDTIGQELSNSF